MWNIFLKYRGFVFSFGGFMNVQKISENTTTAPSGALT